MGASPQPQKHSPMSKLGDSGVGIIRSLALSRAGAQRSVGKGLSMEQTLPRVDSAPPDAQSPEDGSSSSSRAGAGRMRPPVLPAGSGSIPVK